MEPGSRIGLRSRPASSRSFRNTVTDMANDVKKDKTSDTSIVERIWNTVMGKSSESTPVEFRERFSTMVRSSRKHNQEVLAELASESKGLRLGRRDEDEDPDPDGDLDDDTDDDDGSDVTRTRTSRPQTQETSSSSSSSSPPTTITTTIITTSSTPTPTTTSTKAPDLSPITSNVPPTSSSTPTPTTSILPATPSSSTVQIITSSQVQSTTSSTFVPAAVTAERSPSVVSSSAASAASSAADQSPTPVVGKDTNFNRTSQEAMVVTGLGVTGIILAIILIIAFRRRKQLIAAYGRYKDRRDRARAESGRGSFISDPIMAPDSGPQGDGRMVGVSNPPSWNAEKTFAQPDPNLLYAPKPKRGTLSRIRELLAAPLTSNPITRSLRMSTSNKKASWVEPVERDPETVMPNGGDPEMLSMDDDRTKSTGLLYFDGNNDRVKRVVSQYTRRTGSVRTESSEAVDPTRVVFEDRYRESAAGTPLSFPDPPARTVQKDKSFFSWSSGPAEMNQDPMTPKTPRTPRGYGYRDTIMTTTTEATEPTRHRSVTSWVINQQLQKERREDRQRDKDAARMEEANQEPLPTSGKQDLAGFRFTSMSSKGAGSVDGDPMSPQSAVSPRSTIPERPAPAATPANSSSYSGTYSRSFSRPSLMQPLPTSSSYYSTDSNDYRFPGNNGADVPPVPSISSRAAGQFRTSASINTLPLHSGPTPSRAATNSPSIDRSLTSRIASVERAIGFAQDGSDSNLNPFADPQQRQAPPPPSNPFADPETKTTPPLPALPPTPTSTAPPPPISKRKTVLFNDSLNETRSFTTLLSSSYNSTNNTSILNNTATNLAPSGPVGPGPLSSNPPPFASAFDLTTPVPNSASMPPTRPASIAGTEVTGITGFNGTVGGGTGIDDGTAASYRDSRTTASVFRVHPGSRWDVWNKRGFGDGGVRKLL